MRSVTVAGSPVHTASSGSLRGRARSGPGVRDGVGVDPVGSRPTLAGRWPSTVARRSTRARPLATPRRRARHGQHGRHPLQDGDAVGAQRARCGSAAAGSPSPRPSGSSAVVGSGVPRERVPRRRRRSSASTPVRQSRSLDEGTSITGQCAAAGRAPACPGRRPGRRRCRAGGRPARRGAVETAEGAGASVRGGGGRGDAEQPDHRGGDERGGHRPDQPAQDEERLGHRPRGRHHGPAEQRHRADAGDPGEDHRGQQRRSTARLTTSRRSRRS